MPEDKTLNGSNLGVVWKYAVGAASAALALATFYFLAERGQDKEMRDQNEALVTITTTLGHHLEDSRDAARDLRDTMREQRGINKDTSDTLAGLQAEQKSLSEKNGRLSKSIDKLANEIRNRHSRRPE